MFFLILHNFFSYEIQTHLNFCLKKVNPSFIYYYENCCCLLIQMYRIMYEDQKRNHFFAFEFYAS